MLREDNLEMLLFRSKYLKQKDYWIKKLSGELDTTDILSGFAKHDPGKTVLAEREIPFPGELGTRVIKLSKASDLSIYILLLSALKSLIYRYTSREDIIVLSPIDKRKATANTINSLLFIRDQVDENLTFKDVVLKVRQSVLEAYENQDYPYDKLLEYLFPSSTGNENKPVISNVLCTLKNLHGDKNIENITAGLSFRFDRNGDTISGHCRYDTNTYEEIEAVRFSNHFVRFLAGAVENIDVKVPGISYLTGQEKEQLLVEFNGARVEFPRDKILSGLIAEQAERTPDAVAIGFEEHNITYRELNARANRLAVFLRDRGLKTDQPVCILTDRSPWMVESIMGTWKAGGAYIPLDTGLPIERIQYILEDSQSPILLTDSETVKTYLFKGLQGLKAVKLVEVDLLDLPAGEFTGTPGENPGPKNHPADLAYIIFTSGSTGNPKGAMVEHIGMMNHIHAKIDGLQITRRSIVAQNASHTFDISVWQFFAALTRGGKTVIYPDELVFEPHRFISGIIEDQVTVLEVVPSYLSIVLEFLETDFRQLDTLNYLLVTGETLEPGLVERWFERYPEIKAVNAYGPTEASDDITHFVMAGAPEGNRIAVGRPLQNFNIYIVDKRVNLCPVGVNGEICVSGIGVGRGYLNDVEKTNLAFMEDPFYEEEGIRFYKTGDLGRWLPDGNIEFLGRIDRQVKIRGFRLELGEIESQLLKHSEIKEAVVLLKEDKSENKNLCAYIVADGKVSVSELRADMSKYLPGYMVPSFFVEIDHIPLTPNGKIDRKALPEPGVKTGGEYTAPGNEIEEKLVEVWQSVLGKDNIGINENFFTIGGDSIKSIQIGARMNKLGYKVEMRDIFLNPVISQLALKVRKLERRADQFTVTGIVPLTPIQKWFFENKHIDRHHFNQAVMLYSEEGFEESAITAIFVKIQEHHDALRMAYRDEAGKIIQTDRGKDYPFSLQVFDYRDREDGKEALHAGVNEIQASIDLEKGPLMKLGLFHLDDGDRLLIVIHHLVIDGVSWRILLEDLETLYRQYKKREPLVLPLKTDSFKVWAEGLSQYADSEIFLEEKAYWMELESAEVPGIKKDFAVEDNAVKGAKSLSFVLSAGETGLLLTRTNKAFGTEINDILLTALGLSVKKFFGVDKVLVTLEGHGREEVLPDKDMDISRTIGWFTSLYPVIFDFSYEADLARRIKEVKESLRRIPNKGIGYGILKYLTAGERKQGLDLTLKPQISFNYLGQFDAEVGQGAFEIAGESTGNSQGLNGQRDFELDVSGMISNKQLGMTITYNPSQFKPETVERLLEGYKTTLGHIILYCSSRKERELTPSDLMYNRLSIEELDGLREQYGLEDIYPLSPMQEGMYFHYLYDRESSAYFEQVSYRHHGELEIKWVERGLQELFKRHDILRTNFIQVGNRMLQVLQKEKTVDFYYEDISGRKDKLDYLAAYKEKDKEKSFDLSKGALMRVSVMRSGDSTYEFTWSFHHIIMDGWCTGILISEYLELYNCSRENREVRLPAVEPYRTYIAWLTKQDRAAPGRYWEEYLEHYEEAAGIPAPGASRASDTGYKEENVIFSLSREKTIELNRLAARNNVTLNIVTQTVWGLILGCYNNKNDVVFGIVVSGRPAEIEGVESMMGLFVNTVPVRVRYKQDTKFAELFKAVQKDALDSEPYHYFPLAKIQAKSALKQNLLDHILAFENYPVHRQIDKVSEEKILKVSNVEIFEQTNYDFNVVIGPGDRLTFKLSYNANVYTRDFVERVSGHLSRALDQVLTDDGLTVKELNLLSAEEKKRILYNFNDTEIEYPEDKTVCELFEEQANITPDGVALVGSRQLAVGKKERNRETVQLTYRELNRKSDRLARLLIEKGVQPETIVSIMMERSIEMITGIFGILKAGGAYLPIDADYPRERIAYMLADSGAKILLSEVSKVSEVISGETEVIDLPSLIAANKDAEPTHLTHLTHPTHPTHLCYIIYTSGTTGWPRGTLVEHRSSVNLCRWHNRYYKVIPGDRATQYASIGFDASVWEIFPYLTAGASLYIIGDEIKLDIHRLNRFYERNDITIGFLPTQFCQQFMELENRSLRRLLTGGDKLRIFKKMNYDLYNNYGPTENTVVTTSYLVYDCKDNIPIGKPVDNHRIYILSGENLQLQPVGVPGELCISGFGLARGYLNRPELTAERFITILEQASLFPTPYSPTHPLTHSTIYRTGDLARWRWDGNIEFLGRADSQVKIRGFRIEPGEIENVLLKHDKINEAAVIYREQGSGEKYLCAYIVPGPEENIDISQLKDILSRSLPGYMVPSYFVQVNRIPLTSSGKIDRRALPVPGVKGGEYTAPGSEVEKKLTQIWSQVLEIKKEIIGIDDDFFDLGGHSLKVTVLVSVVHKELNIEVPFKEIFTTPTIRGLSKYIESLSENKYISIEAAEEKEYYALSSAQKRLFYLHQLEKDSKVYNLPQVITLEGGKGKPETEAVFKKLIERHESLRTSFHVINEVPVQKIHEPGDIEFEIELPEVSDFVRPFDLARVPLFRIGLIPGGDNTCILVIDMHHIITDGTSQEILVKEFIRLYGGEEPGPLKLQYRDYSEWQNGKARREALESQEEYWLREFAGELPVLNLPGDYRRSSIQSFEGAGICFSINRGEIISLQAISRENGATLFMVLLSAFNILLSRLSGQEDIIVGTPTAGRNHAELQHIVGMFVNTLVLRNYPDGEKSFTRFLQEVKTRALEAFENQDYQFENLVDRLEVSRDTGRNPLFDVVFLLDMTDGSPADISTKEGISANRADVESPLSNVESDTTKFDLILAGEEVDGKLLFKFQYCTKIYKKETIERFIGYFKKIVSAIGENPRIKLGQIDITSGEERNRMLYDLNKMGVDYPRDKTVHELFEEQAEKTPDRVAVVGKGKKTGEAVQLTYGELNRKSNRLAYLLRKKGVDPDSIVGIMLGRSPGMIIAALGILKAGGAYLPLDPAYPGERIKYMLEDSQAPVLLTGSGDIKDRSFTVLQERQVPGFQPFITSSRSPITDFDGLPFPDRSLVNYEKYNRYIGLAMVKNSVSLQGTRGCPYNCAYCHKIWPKKHIVRSAENILEEVLLYYRMGIRRFIIIDDIFNLDKENSARFFKLIIKKGLDLQLFFPNGLRGDLLTKEYIDLMVEAGTAGLALALETASPRLQTLIGKNLNLDKLRENIEYFCEKYPHVILELFTMHGFPTESEEEAMLTLNFIKSLKWLHFPYVHILKIYPNTDMAALALENGVSPEAIARSANLAYHELPETLPFDKNVTLKLQADFFDNYFLLKERLLQVLTYQLQVLTRDEIVQKYDSYLPADINSFADLLEFTGIRENELNIDGYLEEDSFWVPGLNKKIKDSFPGQEQEPSLRGSTGLPLRVLLLDLSQYFSHESGMLYDVVEPPLGLMYIMTYLKRQYRGKINGKIAKSRIDFDNYEELKQLLEDFEPDVIGIRTLTFYKDFFHRTAAMIRHWGRVCPVIAGGPYATSDYAAVLQDPNVDLVVVGEGEITFARLIREIMAHNGQLPEDAVLKEIPGIAFIPVDGVREKSKSVGGNREIILMDALDGDAGIDNRFPREDDDYREQFNKPTDSAYIIYTSGTTGKPKGTLIEHRNVVRLLFNDKFQFDFNNRDVWTMFHSLCFDFSVWEMYGALLYGGKLVMVPTLTAKTPGQFLEVLTKESVTILNQTPAAFYNLAREELERPGKMLKLRYVIFGGDALNPPKLKQWKEKYPETTLINMFGITETTVHVTYKELKAGDIERGIGNIGGPIPTLSVYVMDRYQKLVPIGVAGELCVGGEGVARGYLNRPEQTKTKFVDDPGTAGSVLYKSGDMGRYLGNGDMEYLGRIDQQVKVRGYRIEPGEIENLLVKNDKVKEAVVIPRSSGSSRSLCAYIVPAAPGALLVSDIRTYLLVNLPDYMVPSYFVLIEKIPLTANGKIDRRALPEPGIAGEEEYAAPGNETEEKLAEIWKDALKLERVGISDSFFNLGGDSIKAITVLSLINKTFAANLGIVDLFTNETIEQLSVILNREERGKTGPHLQEVREELEQLKARILERNEIPVEDVEDIFPMSDIEKGMVFHSLKEVERAVYHDQIVHQLNYIDFDPGRLRKAMSLMTEKHPILRTGFHLGDFEDHVQVVHKKCGLDMLHYDISGMERKEQEQYIREFVSAERKKPFNISLPPLWRLRTFSLDKDHIVVLWVTHHAIIDGWSDASFNTELNNIYLKLETTPDFKPEKLKSTYKDFVIEQIAFKKNKGVHDYWKNELADYKRFSFPVGVGEDNDNDPGDMQEYSTSLGSEFLHQLNRLAVRYNTRLKHLCFGAYIYMLGMMSCENDITVGLVTNNRPICEDSEKILGCFLNTIPVRVQIPGSIKWVDYIRLVDEKLVELSNYDRLSLLEIVEIIGEKTGDVNPIFDVLFNFVDFHVYKGIEGPGAVGDGGDPGLSVSGKVNTNTLFEFSIDTTWGDFSVSVSYSRSLISDEMFFYFFRYFERILNKFIQEPESIAAKDELIPPGEKQKLLYDFNRTESGYPVDKTIHGLFAEQAAGTPEKTVIVGRGERTAEIVQLTYRKLDEKSDQVAHYLRDRGVGPDVIVGIMAERSIEMIAGIIGILKAGGAYLPIDPEYPRERIDYMLADSNAKILLSELSELSKVSEGTEVVSLSWLNEDFPAHPAHPTHLCYVIYTSGTTGRPRGTPVEQRSLVNLCWWHNNYYRVSEQDNATQYANISFDASVWEIFPYLIKGAALHIISEDIKLDMQGLSDYYKKHHITISFLPTQLCRQFMEEAGELPSLRCLLTGGDRLNRFVEAGYRLYNNYGPTENTVVTTSCPVEAYKENIPIGKPIDNNRVYILNKDNLQLQPFGVAGELCIAGDSLARGYLNHPELTAEKFISAPASSSNSSYSWGLRLAACGCRLYKTGDLARWLEDGNMEFIGRVDQQVKIRGFRIEPGEIENRLLSHEDINEAIVVSKQDKRGTYRNLCAYFVSGSGLSAADLRRHLSQELPGYMIPSYFVRVEEMPLTPNGKVDRKALPDPLETGERRYTSPRDDMEEKLVEIWSEVLGVPAGIDDNFFELGGHSLRAVFLLSRIHRELNVKIPLEAIFKNPTIEELSNYLKAPGFDRFVSIAPAEEMDYYPVSPAQKRLFILQHMEKENLSYNVPRFLVLVGKFDRGSLEQALVGLINRHENLRTSFEMMGEEPIQRVRRDTDFAVEYCERSEDEARELAYNFIKPFDLGRFPLLRVRLVKTGETRYILMWDMHHIITDGTSMGIFLKEFSALYTGEKLPPLRIQYKDFSRWQNFSTRIEAMNKQEEYWLKEFEGDVPALNLPLDYERPELQTSEGKRIAFEIDTEETKMLKQMALEEGATLYMVLLAMYNVLLSRLCDQEDIVVGSPIAGRRHADLEMLIGFFVNMLALRGFPNRRKTFREFLLEIKERTLKAYENQDYQFEELVDKVLKQRESSRHSLIDVVFAFQNPVLPGDQITGVNIPGITLKPYDHYGEISPFDLGLEGSDAGEKLVFLLHYRTKLFKEETVQKIVQTFKEIVATVSADKNLRLSDINISHDLLSVESSSLREEDGDFEF